MVFVMQSSRYSWEEFLCCPFGQIFSSSSSSSSSFILNFIAVDFLRCSLSAECNLLNFIAVDFLHCSLSAESNLFFSPHLTPTDRESADEPVKSTPLAPTAAGDSSPENHRWVMFDLLPQSSSSFSSLKCNFHQLNHSPKPTIDCLDCCEACDIFRFGPTPGKSEAKRAEMLSSEAFTGNLINPI
ncbi:hypothetical protein SDJN03_12467, partial [Cucurbita argyrosperma subsp. sororia]